jgi:alpha-D-ribose 1-methylphosphonate 5-triphosphate synthase subunit PhnL
MKPLLQIAGLVKRFRLHNQGGVELSVLNGAALTAHAGECVVLAGPSGAGKSTLLRCIYGNYTVQSGHIFVRHDGHTVDVAKAHHRTILELRRRTIGYVSQFLRVVPRVPALDVVAEPLLRAGVDVEKARARAAEMLDRLAIPERMWALAPQTFSGGEQQRINIARGLALPTPLLLLDEPTSALDPDNRQRVAGLIDEAKANGSAVIGVFHDMDMAEAVGTRIFPMTPAARAA